MSTTTETELPSPVRELPTPDTTNIATVCQTGDTECLKRLVQAFSDCD
jgi:hypothetical protein